MIDLAELEDRLHQLPSVTAYQGETLRWALAAVAELTRLRERCEVLRKALLKRGTWNDGEGITCPLCEFEWDVCHSEYHAKDCLASPGAPDV